MHVLVSTDWFVGGWLIGWAGWGDYWWDCGLYFGGVIEIDDPIRDALGGVVGEQVGELLGTLSSEQTERINHDLQAAFRDAFREALYDIGGEACFAHAWQGGASLTDYVSIAVTGHKFYL